MVKSFLKKNRSTFYSLTNYFYDWYRFANYSGISSSTRSQLDYKILKAYHKVEKSLSFNNRKKNSGNGAAVELLNILYLVKRNFGFFNDIDIEAIKVLEHYRLANDECSQEIKLFLARQSDVINNRLDSSGSKLYSKSLLHDGILDNPEKFFLSRYSIRELSSNVIKLDIIYRAIKLAMKTPSACNRQPWKVYILQDDNHIKRALKYQNGNAGFGDTIKNLLIVCVDIEAFNTNGERNQHWIDGGMFSMSLVMAFHSLGLGSCCLNWSKGIKDDLKLRKELNIPKSYAVLMFLAVGEPIVDFKVCSSNRFDLNKYIVN